MKKGNAVESILFEMRTDCVGKPDSFKINWLVRRFAAWIEASVEAPKQDAVLQPEPEDVYNDIKSSFILAMQNCDIYPVTIDEIVNTVEDYFVNNYGD